MGFRGAMRYTGPGKGSHKCLVSQEGSEGFPRWDEGGGLTW